MKKVKLKSNKGVTITDAKNAEELQAAVQDALRYDSEILIEEFINGNFENGTSSWRGAVNLSNTVKKEGNNALVISSTSKDWVGVDQLFSVPADAKSVTISGWLKSDNIVQGENVWNNGLLNVEFTSDGKTKTANDESITFVTGTKDWQQYSKTFNLPKDTQKLRLMIALGFATGTLYADDIKVTFNK